MVSSIFSVVGETWTDLFSEEEPAKWVRFDGPANGDDLRVEFLDAYVDRNVQDWAMIEGEPTAWVLLSDALAVAPDRAANVNLLFNNNDRLVIGGIRYCIESFSRDPYGKCEIALSRKQDAR